MSLRTTVDFWFVGVELSDPERFVGALPTELDTVRDSPCGAPGLGAAPVAIGVSVVGSDGTGSAEGAGAADCWVGNSAFGCCGGNVAAGGSAGAAVATAVDTPVWVGVAPADAMVSLFDGVELVCAPPELCTIPERGSAVEPSLGEEVELAWRSTELCTIPDVEPEEEPVAEGEPDVEPEEEPVAEGEPDDEPEESDDEPEESDDEPEELESVGSANAIPGVVATAPTLSANATAPTQPMYLAYAPVTVWRGFARRAV